MENKKKSSLKFWAQLRLNWADFPELLMSFSYWKEDSMKICSSHTTVPRVLPSRRPALTVPKIDVFSCAGLGNAILDSVSSIFEWSFLLSNHLPLHFRRHLLLPIPESFRLLSAAFTEVAVGFSHLYLRIWMSLVVTSLLLPTHLPSRLLSSWFRRSSFTEWGWVEENGRLSAIPYPDLQVQDNVFLCLFLGIY